jgi:CRISPR-associated protein Csy2
MSDYLIIRKMYVNEVSMDAAPVVNGFPAVPAIMGFVHALQRKLQKLYPEIRLEKAAISSHSFTPGVYRIGNNIRPAMSKNPAYSKKHIEKETLKGVPFVEEGKASLCASLLIKINKSDFIPEQLCKEVAKLLPTMRFSGGIIWKTQNILFKTCSEHDEQENKEIIRQLMPGFVLIERSDLIKNSVSQNVDALDALLDHLQIDRVDEPNEDDKPQWKRKCEESGWLVPIVVGYRDITGTMPVQNQRDQDSEHCFAENIITLGEFVMPVRFASVEEMLWQPFIDEKNGLYAYNQINKN